MNFRDFRASHALMANPTKGTSSLFKIHSANTWLEMAKSQPIPKMLFGELWHQGELGILFSDTNQGKSILAVQIADSISKGIQIPGFKLEAEPQTVLYFDFELSAKQFELRYSENFTNHHNFSERFMRVEIDPEALPPDNISFEKHLNESLEKSVSATAAKVLIIDNITYLKDDTEKAKDALPLMKDLKKLKTKYGLSILVLAHTPKRDLSKPVTRNDLGGSKMLINFCDSAFTIGESQTNNQTRYIKQIKERNTQKMYGADNVCVCEICKPHNFTKFLFMGFSSEFEHLKSPMNPNREELINKARDLSSQGKTQREIADDLGISLGAVNKYLKL